jgi:RNA polymerase sigma-70 factor (ECF subfamily)
MKVPEPNEEKKLVIRLKKGDQEAFRILYDKYIAKLLVFLKSYTQDTRQADEAIQQIFINIWQSHDKINPDLSFQAYLIRSLKNYIYNQYRDQVRLFRRRERFLQEVPENRVEQPDEFLQLKELESLLREKIQNLPPVQQEIFLMSRDEGLSNEEIASKLNVSRRTVENHIYLALRKLKKSFPVQEKFMLVLFLWVVH